MILEWIRTEVRPMKGLMLAVLLFGCGCGDDCKGVICDSCKPGQFCCAGTCQAVYDEQEDGSLILLGHYCLDTPQQTCPVPQW